MIETEALDVPIRIQKRCAGPEVFRDIGIFPIECAVERIVLRVLPLDFSGLFPFGSECRNETDERFAVNDAIKGVKADIQAEVAE